MFTSDKLVGIKTFISCRSFWCSACGAFKAAREKKKELKHISCLRRLLRATTITFNSHKEKKKDEMMQIYCHLGNDARFEHASVWKTQESSFKWKTCVTEGKVIKLKRWRTAKT